MIYTIATQKGGTGKTTTAAALAQAAAYKGKSCLAIDLDPQANLTYCLAADETQPGSYDLLHGAAASQVTQTTAQSIDVISASPDLQTETSSRGSARRLQKALAPLKDQYDVIIIDTPATAGELQYFQHVLYSWLSPPAGCVFFFLSYKLWMLGASKYNGTGS